MHIKEWYFPSNKKDRDALHWEMFKYCRTRSIAMLGEEKKDRFINAGKIGPFKKELKGKFSQENPYWGFYASVEHLAKTNQTDRQTFKQHLDEGMSLEDIADKYGTFEEAVKNKKEELENNKLGKTVYFPANWKQHWYDFIYDTPGYDLVFDIDGDHLLENPEEASKKEIIKAAQEEAAKIVEYFQKKNVPFYVKFSGGRGFHIGIPRERIEDYFDNNDYSQVAGLFAQFVTDKTGAEVDFSIYKDRQIYRVPYSMHQDSNLICMPLTNDQFWNFELKYASPDWIRSNVELRDRGLCTRSGKVNKVIKQFRDWKENEFDGEIEEKTTKKKKNSRVEKVIDQYKALSKEEQNLFMEAVN